MFNITEQVKIQQKANIKYKKKPSAPDEMADKNHLLHVYNAALIKIQNLSPLCVSVFEYKNATHAHIHFTRFLFITHKIKCGKTNKY